MNTIYEPTGKAFEYAPLALNLYTGCGHGCRYCYAPSIARQTLEQFAAGARPRAGILDALRAEVKKRTPDDRPVLLCFTSDPYQPIEETEQLTHGAIRILGEEGFKIRVLTKGTLRAMLDLDLFRRYYVDFGVTLVFSNEQDRQEWEPGANATGTRLEALGIAHRAGVRTWVSLEPVFDPAQTIDLMRRAAGTVDVWRIGKLNHDAKREATINWPAFLADALAEVTRQGVGYYIKDDLWRFATPDIKAAYPKSDGVPLWNPTENTPRRAQSPTR